MDRESITKDVTVGSRQSTSRACSTSGCDARCIFGFAYCVLHAQPEECRAAIGRYIATLESVALILDRSTADARKLAAINRLVHEALR